MVTLEAMKASNDLIPNTLPAGLVAVFVGGTSGIGEYTLKRFAHHAVEPRIYFTGRSQASGDRIAADLAALNPTGTYTFLRADTSLIANVDALSRTIAAREPAVNLLFLTTYNLEFYTATPESRTPPSPYTSTPPSP